MKQSILMRLFDCIGGIEDYFLAEAESTSVTYVRTVRRSRNLKYGAYGAAGIAVLGGAAAAVWKLRANRIAKSA